MVTLQVVNGSSEWVATLIQVCALIVKAIDAKHAAIA